MKTFVNQILALIPFQPDLLHRKRGTVYRRVGTCKLEADWSDAVLYQAQDGTLIARRAAEMEDGRFAPIDVLTPAASLRAPDREGGDR